MSGAGSGSQSASMKRKVKSSKNKGARKRGKFSGSMAVQRMMVPTEMKRMLELKAVDLDAATNNFDTTGTVTLLNGLLVGANSYNRIGRAVTMKSVLVRGLVRQYQVGATPAWDFLRLALVYDKQSDGAAPTWSNVFSSVTKAGAVNGDAFSPVNLDNADRFVVLRDQQWKVDPPGGSTSVQNAQVSTDFKEFSFKWFVKLADLPAVYTATASTGNVSDIQSGGLFILSYGINSNANSQYLAEYTSRVRFTDG